MSWIRYTQECLDASEGVLPTKRSERKVSIRVFENDFMEFVLGRAHPVTPIIWFGPFIAAGLYRVARGPLSIGRGAALFIAGLVAMSLLEYVLHRFLFHWVPDNREGRFRHFMMHGYHHQFPNDPMRLVAPPLMSWPVAAVVIAVYYAALGPSSWLQAFAGTSLGYIAYDWTHYYTHHFKPTTRLGKWMRDYHIQHHHDPSPTRYGVSSPIWDMVFGTYVPPKRAGSATAE